MTDLLDKSIKELSEGIKNKNFSIEDLLDESYGKIEEYNNKFNSFITVVDRKPVSKSNLTENILSGLPFSMKDAYATKGVRTTAGSSVLADFIPPYSATVYEKLKGAGAILVGKNSQDAWGHGASSENTDFRIPKNPWDNTRVAGGSSGGSASAVAMRLVSFSIGEDTGGSIRNPSAWCGVTGLKVSYGRVSRYGAIAYASSFDTVGPIAKSVEDCAIVLSQIAGLDKYDATSSPNQVPDYLKLLNGKEKYTIGVPKEFFNNDLDRDIDNSIKKAIGELEKLDFNIEEVSFPDFDFVLSLYYIIAPSETSSNLARYDGIRYGENRDAFTEETKRRIMVATISCTKRN